MHLNLYFSKALLTDGPGIFGMLWLCNYTCLRYVPLACDLLTHGHHGFGLWHPHVNKSLLCLFRGCTGKRYTWLTLTRSFRSGEPILVTRLFQCHWSYSVLLLVMQFISMHMFILMSIVCFPLMLMKYFTGDIPRGHFHHPRNGWNLTPGSSITCITNEWTAVVFAHWCLV